MRLRLSLILLLLMTVVVVSLGAPLAGSIAATEARTVYVDRLADLALFASVVPSGSDAADTDPVTRDLRRYDEVYGVAVAVVDTAGRTRIASRPGPLLEAPGTRAAMRTALAGRLSEEPARLWPWMSDPVAVAHPVVRDGDVVGAVVSVSQAQAARRRVLSGWLLLAVLGGVALIGGAVLADRLAAWLLRPIQRLDDAAHRIADGDLTARVPAGSGPPEVRRLGRSFNDMASHVQAALEAQRSFVADASHQLRNPLAALMVRLEGLRLAPVDQVREAAARAADDGRYLADTLDRMLELAKAEHTTTVPGPLDVAAVVDGRLNFWHVVAARRSITLRRSGDAAAPGWHDPGALAGAVDAVLDNALKYSPERTAVTVEVRRQDVGTAVVVSDEGPGLAPEEMARATDRFWRARSTSAEPGSGLGMSIASTLLERHGGRLEVASAPEGGLQVRLVVPQAGGGADGQGLVRR